MSPADGPTEDETTGATVVNLSYVGTGVLVVVAAAGAAAPDTFGPVTAVAAVALFALGVVGILYGYANGVVRSRDEQVHLGGLFFLSGTAPRVVAFRLRVALAVQVVAAVAAASVRPYTAVAFAVLGPMFGLGQLAVWGARHGWFPAKVDDRPGRRRRDAAPDRAATEVDTSDPLDGSIDASDPTDGSRDTSDPTDGATDTEPA